MNNAFYLNVYVPFTQNYTSINTESEIKICNLETFLFQAFKQVDLTTEVV